jgi:tetratricopeptide (TPR) repeat protein
MHMIAGEHEEAERILRDSIEIFDSAGGEGFVSTLALELAETLFAQGRLDEAEPWVERGRSGAAEDDVLSQMWWRATTAKILAHRGSVDEAERLAREAVDVGDRTDYLDDRGRLWMRLGEVLRMAGKNGESAEAVKTALGLFERKGNEVSAERARRKLADLEP